MRKFVLLSLLGVVAAFTCAEDTSACWRHRRSRCCAPGPAVYCYTSSVPTPKLRLPSKPVLGTELLITPHGTSHRLITIDHEGWKEPAPPEANRLEGLAGKAAAAGPEIFNGNDREAAKTSVSQAGVVPFASLGSLIATLPSDDFMRHEHQPPISKARTSGRVTEEQQNVTVPAYLVATKKEGDHDYHLLLASTPDGDGPYLTAEVSGLPRMGSPEDAATLAAARQQYRVLLQGRMPGPRYKLVDPPLPVSVTGSLFYDMDHAPGVVGTGDFVPDTSWEIHPITSIVHGR